MRIAIDGRFWGLVNTGIGRYLVNLVKWLAVLDTKNQYWLFLNKEGWRDFNLPNERWHKVRLDVPHYSIREQFVLPITLSRVRPDILHVPHFNVPIFWPGRMVVTIHDLLWHEWRGGNATTLSPFIYWFKYLGFKVVFAAAVSKAKKILVPSNWVKNELVRRFATADGKVEVTYEGVDEGLITGSGVKIDVLKKYGLRRERYLLYVGNIYPHKNLETLLEAMKGVDKALGLVVVCGRDLFQERLKEMVRLAGLERRVKWLGFVEDRDLAKLYKGAVAFVFPSLSEGFGLPGLEAMATGVPVIAARATSLPEVLGESVVYFSGRDSEDLRKKIEQVVRDVKLRRRLAEEGKRWVKRYSWRRMAEETLRVYEKAG